MDKLEPILKHHFWILAFLVLPLGLWGYYSANSSLIAATDTREAELDGVFTGIREGNSPNQTWEAEMKLIADEYEQMAGIATMGLHEEQEARMDWPPLMAPYKPAEYRGAWDGDRHFAYTQVYPQLLDEVWRRYQPVVTTLAEGDDRSWVTWDEKVLIDSTAIQPVHQFGVRRATDEQIWDAQEDIWLHRLIADAVVRTNEDADGVYTSVVKMIQQVELMGGDGTPVAAGGATTSSSSQSSSFAETSNYMENFGGGSQGRGGSMSSVAVAFDPAEEIGSGGRAAATRGSGGYGGSEMMLEGSGSSGRPGGSSGSGGQSSTVLRYVDFNEGDRARVRAFYMSVIVHQTKFPEFLVELCNSEWPIQILRFNVGPNPYYQDPMSMARGGVMGTGGYGTSGTMGGRPTMGGRQTTGMGPMSPMGPMGRSPMGRPPMGPLSGTPMGSGGVRQQTHEAFGALNSPDLVQLDLLGLITIFNPATRPAVAVTESTASESSSTADGETADVDATEVPVPEPSEDSSPTPEGSETPVDETSTESSETNNDAENMDPTETTSSTELDETVSPESASEDESVPAIEEPATIEQ